MEAGYKMTFLGQAATLADSHIVILIAGVVPADYEDKRAEGISMRNIFAWRGHPVLAVSSGLTPAEVLFWAERIRP